MIIDWNIAEATGILASDYFNFNASGIGEIMQNVRTIVTTRKGTCQLDRKFGIDGSFLDRPINLVTTQLIGAALSAIHLYEPRVQVTGLTFSSPNAGSGNLIVNLTLKVLTTQPYQGSWQPL